MLHIKWVLCIEVALARGDFFMGGGPEQEPRFCHRETFLDPDLGIPAASKLLHNSPVPDENEANLGKNSSLTPREAGSKMNSGTRDTFLNKVKLPA